LVDHRVFGYQQLDRRVVEIQVELDVADWDLRRPQVDHDLAMAGTDLKAAGAGPVAQPLRRAVVGVDLGWVVIAPSWVFIVVLSAGWWNVGWLSPSYP
jgi:hypothetical protein